MNIKVFDKLVRDKVPEIMKQQGLTGIFEEVTSSEYKKALTKRILAEASKLDKTGNEKNVAGLLDAIEALFILGTMSRQEVEEIRHQEFEQKGEFNHMIKLKCVIDNENTYGV